MAPLLTPPQTEPPGDLAGLLRAQELVDPIRANPHGGRDLTDRQDRLMGFDDASDPLLLGFFEPFRTMHPVQTVANLSSKFAFSRSQGTWVRPSAHWAYHGPYGRSCPPMRFLDS